ncbi:MAG: cysteine desulfurase [Rhodospirillales bacterium]|jgi:cysteine desulfurase|nr:cysteine desulfurase [Rhodospirillales bacterium]MBT5075787.1 cysteine desulfurase [Rhodospirillales bacterium]MBT5114390.1 cysteine desulfurase [Rhodospirillales bacterium]MBT5672782.1 cysteine desulfurase [Rhodospirillales bacterium]MBT6187007.1 cysteine desulfurase [Rhodospirillales bacterium]
MPHYLDYNATAPVRSSVREAVDWALGLPGNPSSVHGAGRAARAAVEDARIQVAALCGVAPASVVFTATGSEANNLALYGSKPRRIIVSAVEHPSVLRPAAERPNGFAMIGVDGDGVADMAELEQVLDQDSNESPDAGPVLVSVMMANNETGVIQPVRDVVRIARAHGALIHCDAVQAAGRVVLDFAGFDFDFMSLSAHKIGGPKGIGALIVKPGRVIAPLISGGGQERGFRAGTENVPGIVGFGVAATHAAEEAAGVTEPERLAKIRDRIETAVKEQANDAVIIGASAPRLFNTSCIAVPGRKAETQVIALDLAGVQVSAGSACSSGKVEASHVLSAMGLAPDIATSAIRVSLGFGTTTADGDAFIDAWRSLGDRAIEDAAR